MNISRRSIVFSFIFHASLVCAGTAFFLLFSSEGQGVPASERTFKVTPVVLSKPQPKAAPEKPIAKPPQSQRVPARSSARSQAPTRSVPETRSQAAQREVRQQPQKAAPQSPQIPSTYPKASAVPRQPSNTPGSASLRPRRGSETAPLWTPDTAPSQPLASASPTASPGPGSGEQHEGNGAVSYPSPIGIIDPGKDVPSLRALASANIEVEFDIAADGKVTNVRLLQGSGNAQVDQDLQVYFRGFRWNPKTVAGIAVAAKESMDFQHEPKR